MENKRKYLKKLNLINQIEQVRKKNNKNWMDILRIAFEFAPDKTAHVLSEIYKEDKKINHLAKKLTKKI